MKKIIAAVILLVLIVAAFSMLSTPSVRADDTSQVQILSYSWYIVPSTTTLTTWTLAMYTGDLVVVGEVKNVSPDTIGGLSLSGFAYNSTGQLLDYAIVTPFVYDMLPGQKAPFYLDFNPENIVTGGQGWESSFTNITVLVSDVSDTNETQYSGLTISSSRSFTDSNGTFNVDGNVRNNGAETVGDVWVDATFYNASGTVVGLGITSPLTSSLAPGNSVAFTVVPYDAPISGIKNYSLLIQSDPFTGSATPSPSVTSSSQPSSSPTASSGPSKYSTPISSGLIYAIVVAVVIIAVVLVTLPLLWKRHKNTQLEPPPPPPPPPPSP